ncbi:MAG TPA: hypothetical protein VLE02_01305 [Nitrosarchaeum sp.]|nr:hypothetical protein [Nitrosarchaeum sp.]
MPGLNIRIENTINTDHVEFSVINWKGEEVRFIMKLTQSFILCVRSLIQRGNLPAKRVAFTFGREVINPELTIAQLGIYDNCIVKAITC